MNNSFLSFLTPKEPKFFPLLKNLSDVIYEASKLLEESMKNYTKEDSDAYFSRIKEMEKMGDELSNKVFEQLNSTFITPFDREDIHMLGDRMDDVIDRINSTSKKLVVYKPNSMPAGSVDLAHQLVEGAVIIQKCVDSLIHIRENSVNLKKNLADLHNMENKADDIYNEFLINLFENETNPIEVIKQKEIMSEMEKATDIAESVGKIIETIIIKYA